MECVFHRDRSGIEFRLDGSPLDLQDVPPEFQKELEFTIGANFLDQSFEHILSRIKLYEFILFFQNHCDQFNPEQCDLTALGV